MAGTDAHITFTLSGNLGTTQKTIDSSLVKRMKRNEWNFVTFQSSYIGDLTSITVQRDNDGNAPDRTKVRSYRFGTSKEAVFKTWMDTTTPHTRAVV